MIGSTTSQTLDLTLLNKGNIIYSTNQIKIEIGLKIGSAIEYIPIGLYNIDDVEKTDYIIKFTAFDNMIKFETPYFSNLGDTPTLTQVVNELASKTGVQFIGSLPSYTVKKLEGFTCREILSYVASVCGGNALITRDGKFTIVYPKDINYYITGDNYVLNNFKREEVKYKIGKVSCQVKEKEIISKGSLGTDSMELLFENPWVSETILTDIYNRLNGFEYLGYSLKWQGDISLDVGDIITCTDVKGVVRKLPILSKKFTYTGGLTSEIAAKGESKNKNSFSSSGNTTNKVNRVVTDLALVNKAFVDYAHINDADIVNLKAETAKIHNLEAETANINTILAGSIGSGSIQTIHLTGKNVVIDKAVIKDAMIDTISAAKINTGVLDTNLVTVQGPSGNLLIKDNTIQIKDANRTRVQIGKDASNDYNMYVWDATGKLMFDATGLKADGIKSKIIRDDMVSDTANINGSKINISSLITEVNKDNTQTLKASKIAFDSTGQSLEVSFNSLKSNVDNLEIGGRNLVDNSTGNLGIEEWTNGGVADFTAVESGGVESNSLKLVAGINDTARKYISQVLTSKFIDLNNLKQVTLSFWYKASENSDVTGVGSFLRISNRTSLYNDVLSSTHTLMLDGQWHYKTITEDLGRFSNTDITNITLFFFTYLGIVEYSNIKLEFGSKATDWTPSPEDIDQKIEANTTAIKVAQGEINGLIKDSSIIKGDVTTLKDNYTSVKATVDGISTTVASHSSTIGDLTSNVSTMQTSITQLNNQITLKVEKADITNAVNGIKIGGTNLIKKSETLDTARLLSTVANTSEIISSVDPFGKTSNIRKVSIGSTATNDTFRINNVVTANGLYTFSVWYKSAIETDQRFIVDICDKGNTTFTATQQWQIAVITVDVQNYSSSVNNFVDIAVNKGHSILFYRGKLETGNKNSDWSSAEEDTTDAISTVDERVTTTNNKVASIETSLNSITQRVSNTESSVTTINNNVTSLQTRMSSAEQKITADAIVSTVRSSSNYTSDLNAKANQSDLNTTNTNVSGLQGKINTVEQKITATAITTTISSAISGGTSSINTTQFVMDKNGLLIKNGALTIQNNAGTKIFYADTAGNITFTGRLQPSDYQIKLFGNDCKIDGSTGAIRLVYNQNNYVGVDKEAARFWNSNNLGGTRYGSIGVNSEYHLCMWGQGTMVKLLSANARPVVQSRNTSDNAYGDFHGADFLNRSTIKDKTNILPTDDIDFNRILLENNIKRYSLKSDVENVLDLFKLDNSLDEVVGSSADLRLGFILEELTQDAKTLLSPGNMESISIYSMCSILWKVCQEQQKRIEALESLQM